jgi:hypothetical protein
VEEARWEASSWRGGGEIGGRRGARERAGGVGGSPEWRRANGTTRSEWKDKRREKGKKLNIKENIIGREQRKINRKKKKKTRPRKVVLPYIFLK